MALSPIHLGALIDKLVETNKARIVETPTALTISNLAKDEITQIYRTINSDWRTDIVDGAMEPIEINNVDEYMGPYILTITKPTDTACMRILTDVGFCQILESTDAKGIWQIANATLSFTTGLASFNPWGQGDVFSPAASTKSPLEIVREGGESRFVPSDIRKWLLRSSVTDALWQDRAFKTFVRAASGPLIRSISSEIIGKSTIIFAGPPRIKLAVNEPDLISDLQQDGFMQIQSAAAWIYEDPIATEQRHALFTAEVSRSVNRDESIGYAFRKAGKDILEGARLAYQLSQSDLSREAIKAQGDLRKAIADDMAKAAESTRSLSTATAVSIITGIGLIAARSATTTNPIVLSSVTTIVALYLLAVTFSGWQYLKLQKKLRTEWRQRFYRFIPSEDYNAMAAIPAAEAERPYKIMAIISIIIALILIFLSWIVGDNATINTSINFLKVTEKCLPTKEAACPLAASQSASDSIKDLIRKTLGR